MSLEMEDATRISDPNEPKQLICSNHELVKTCGRFVWREGLSHEIHHEPVRRLPEMMLETVVRLTKMRCCTSTKEVRPDCFTANRIAKTLSNVLDPPICKRKDTCVLAESFEPLLVDVGRVEPTVGNGNLAGPEQRMSSLSIGRGVGGMGKGGWQTGRHSPRNNMARDQGFPGTFVLKTPAANCSAQFCFDADHFASFRFHAVNLSSDGFKTLLIIKRKNRS